MRELVLQSRDMPAAHHVPTGRPRPRPEDWYVVYQIDEALAYPAPRNVLIVDDALTAGADFAGIKCRLRERFPGLGQILGCFYARRALQASVEE